MNLRDYQSQTQKIRHWVDTVLIISKEGLIRPVINAYKQHYGINYMNHIKATLQTNATDYAPDVFMSDETLLDSVDAYGCFQLMLRRWKYLFHHKLGTAGKNRVQLLHDLRNDWAHEKPILIDNARLAAEAALHLLKDFYVDKEAALMRDLLQELHRLQDVEVDEETSTSRPVSIPAPEELTLLDDSEDKFEPETTAFQPISLNGNYHLTIVTPDGETRYVPVPMEVERISIGRGSGNDITVKDEGISREHLLLMKNEKDEMTIVDLNSRNGTTIDGKTLSPNTPQKWFPGTRVVIGGTWLILRREASTT